MGEVFLANDLQLNRKVALKVLSDSVANDKERLRRFEQEAKAASALNHPNILTIFEFGAENGTQFLVTEYIQGETLRERIQRNPLALFETIEIGIQIASALQSAHSAHIIHRDIKPENVMIREDGYVKVLDFGLAKLVQSAPFEKEAQTFIQVHTLAGMILGTVGYMSPEQARGKAVDGRTDFFSLGAVLYEMLTGRQPFTGETVNHTIVAILENEPPPLSLYIQDYPAEIERITQKCLAKNANDRYQTAKDLIVDLKVVKQEVDSQTKTKDIISVDNKTETRTEILNIHTDKIINIETDPINAAPTHKNPFVILTDKAKQVFRFRGSVAIVSTLIALGLIAFFLLPKVWRTTPKSEAVKLFNNGTEALREGTYYKASKMFEDAVQIDNDFSDAHAGLAEAWMELDYFGRAQSEMLKVNEIRNKQQTLFSVFYKFEDSLYSDAINAIVMRDFPRAIEVYQKIAERNPNEPYVYLDLGRAYEKNEEVDKAIDCYGKAINLNSQYGAGFLRLGILLRRKAQYDKSDEAFDKAENIYDRFSNDEGVAEVKYQRGVSFNIQEKLNDAQTQFEQVIINPRSNKHQQIRAMMQISSVCNSIGKTLCAEEYASKAVTLAKQERMENLAANGFINLGNAFLARAEYGKAEQNFQQAIEFSRQDEGLHNEARALLSMGSLRIQQKKPDEAEDFVRQALPFFQKGGYQKEVAQANLILGRANEMKENYDVALQAFTQVANSNKASPADQAYAEMVIGIVLMNKEKYPEALNHYERSYELYQSLDNPYYTAYSLFYIIENLSQLGRFDAAKEKLSQVQEILQKTPSYQKQLSPRVSLLNAQIALSRRNFTEAINEANRALESTDSSITFEANKIVGLAQAYTNSRNTEGIKNCNKSLQHAINIKNLRAINTAKLALAEIYSLTGKPSESLEIALQSKSYFVPAGQLESGWRSLLIAAQASQQKGDTENARNYASEALAILSQMQSNWGQEHFSNYLTKADINFYFNEAQKLAKS